MTETPPLAVALAAEHAAIFAYGPIGVWLDEELADQAREAEASHREWRDTLMLHLTSQGLVPSTGAPSYTLPFEVTGVDSALRLAVQVEESAAGVWRALLARTDDSDRSLALAGLLDCALRATNWRVAAGMTPFTRVFPGVG